MTRTVRSRRAEMAAQPLYARVLRLRHLAPSGLLCFVFLEGAVVLGILLALAELVSWWGVLVLPITVALMVKFNDLIAGTFAHGPVTTETASARVAVLRPAAMPAAGGDQADEGWDSSTANPDWFGEEADPGWATGRAGVPGANRGWSSVGAGQQQAGGNWPSGGVVSGQAQPVYGRSQAGGAVERSGAARPAATGAPVRRPWADQLDVRQQVARQAAARRYE